MTSKTALKAVKYTTVVSVFTNAAISLIKIIVGFITQSTALIADGAHSFADMISDFFTYIMVNIAHTEPDEDHPYGHGKFETIGTLFMAILLAGTAFFIGKSAITSLIYGEGTLENIPLAALAAFLSIISNEGLYWYCKYWGEKSNSTLIIANAWHHRSDSLSSIAVLIGIGLTFAGYNFADDVAALFITVLLVKMSYKIGRSAFNELVETAVEPELQKEMKQIIKNTQGSLGCHRLRARRIGTKILVDAHVDVDSYISVGEGHAISEDVEYSLKQSFEDISDVTVHIDPKNIWQKPLSPLLARSHIKEIIEKALEQQNKNIQLHRFYLHPLKKRTELELTLAATSLITEEETQNIKSYLEKSIPLDINITISQTMIKK